MMSGQVQWTIVAAPNAGWATQVFGEPDLERLWEAVVDRDAARRRRPEDVVEEWRAHRDLLGARAEALTDLGLDAVRYHGEGTDLTVGLIAGCVWIGGGLTTDAGVAYMPNLPTEEVFTSPDRRRADGVIRTTRPLVMPGAGVLVEDLVVTFAGGRIVDATASHRAWRRSGPSSTATTGARSLGEVVAGRGLLAGPRRRRHLPRHAVRREHRLPRRLGPGLPVLRARTGCRAAADELRGARPELLLARTPTSSSAVRASTSTASRADGTVVPLIREDAWALPEDRPSGARVSPRSDVVRQPVHGRDLAHPALLEVLEGLHAPRPWCSSRTARPRRPARGSAGRRARAPPCVGVRLSCRSSALDARRSRRAPSTASWPAWTGGALDTDGAGARRARRRAR